MKTITAMMCLFLVGCSQMPSYCVVKDSYNTNAPVYAPVYSVPVPKTIKRTVTRTIRYIPASEVPKGAVK
jgi:hypothetical protein